VLEALRNRMAKELPAGNGGPAVLVHAVSVGEVNATRDFVKRLHEGGPAGLQIVLTTTTQTGIARARELYKGQADVSVVRFPLDFTSAVGRLLDTYRVKAAVLMELEVWPNFLRQCRVREIPVAVINGRVTETSFVKYKRIKFLGMFRNLAHICAQEEIYAKRFIEMGARRERVSVTGTMKFDSADLSAPPFEALAAAVGLLPGAEPIWVCGSTGPGEEEIVLKCYRGLLVRFPKLRLVVVPRHPERFGEVAALIEASGFKCQRRSAPVVAEKSQVILGDTMGELRAWYAMADVVFVGRTLVDLGPKQHGSDMIEPAALGKAVVLGTFTGNFTEPMGHFVDARAMAVVRNEDDLAKALGELLSDPAKAAGMGQKARRVVMERQGATERHVRVVLNLI
jgi:3-deoxy-D-manno-octulosonic-acid transferase